MKKYSKQYIAILLIVLSSASPIHQHMSPCSDRLLKWSLPRRGWYAGSGASAGYPGSTGRSAGTAPGTCNDRSSFKRHCSQKVASNGQAGAKSWVWGALFGVLCSVANHMYNIFLYMYVSRKKTNKSEKKLTKSFWPVAYCGRMVWMALCSEQTLFGRHLAPRFLKNWSVDP